MADYDNTNRGVLFKNTRRTNDKQPNFNGSININGTEHWLSGWQATRKETGETYVRLQIGDPKEAKGAAPAAKPAPRRVEPTLDDDMPF